MKYYRDDLLIVKFDTDNRNVLCYFLGEMGRTSDAHRNFSTKFIQTCLGSKQYLFFNGNSAITIFLQALLDNEPSCETVSDSLTTFCKVQKVIYLAQELSGPKCSLQKFVLLKCSASVKTGYST